MDFVILMKPHPHNIFKLFVLYLGVGLTPYKKRRLRGDSVLFTLITIAVSITSTVLIMNYINSHRYPSLPQFLMFIAIAITIFLALVGIGFIMFFSLLDPLRFRLVKRCDGCIFAFRYADFSNAELEGAILINSNISGANFRNANLRKANLSSTRSSPSRPNFQGTNLRESNLSNASLPNIILTNAQLQNSNLQNAHLFGAELSGANLQNSNLFGANLTRANTVKTDFTGADLRNTKMCFLSSNRIKLDRAKLKGARITIEEGESDFTRDQKKMFKKRGAILGGPSELCY